MKNLLKGIGAGFLAIAFILTVSVAPVSVRASGEKFIVEQVFRSSSTNMGVGFFPNSGGTLGSEQLIDFTAGSYSNETALANEIKSQIADWANNNGYSGITSSDVYSYKPLLATVATTGSYNDLTNLPSARSQSSASRSLNTCFQVSSTRDVLVNYSVDIAATLSLAGGQTGTTFLELYNDSGCTTGTQELSRSVNGNTGTLTIGLNITQNITGGLNGYVPAGKYVKIRTANTAGTPTFTYRSGQEVQL